MRYTIAALACAGLVVMPVAHADPDDGDNTDQIICGSFDAGVPPGEIPGRLGANDGRWNYWRAQQRTRDDIVEGHCP
jgi:hypothetical protein